MIKFPTGGAIKFRISLGDAKFYIIQLLTPYNQVDFGEQDPSLRTWF